MTTRPSKNSRALVKKINDFGDRTKGGFSLLPFYHTKLRENIRSDSTNRNFYRSCECTSYLVVERIGRSYKLLDKIGLDLKLFLSLNDC